MQKRHPVDFYVDGILSGNRVLLSRTITLIESQLSSDQDLAQQVLAKILPYTGKSIRIGITGVPGVGKSTFIEAFGLLLTASEKKLVAVLTIDPSSQRSKGSIMGDKTRMEALAHHPLAYIRPSPSNGSLGGVANKTRETMLLCEAAGFELIFIETVGVGQSETIVKGMVDFFLLLMLAGAGDELQGIKKGIMEMADAVVITKADGVNQAVAQRAVIEYQNAFHLFAPNENGWFPPIKTCSALEKQGLSEIWKVILEHHTLVKSNGFFLRNRQYQNLEWMHTLIQGTLKDLFFQHPKVQARLSEIEDYVQNEKWLPIKAANFLIDIFKN